MKRRQKPNDIYSQLGFNPNASPSAVRALLNHCRRAAQESSQVTITPQQLSFDPQVLGIKEPANSTRKKRGA